MKLTRVATVCLLACALAASACVPDPLDAFAGDTGTTPNPNAMTGDMTGTPDMGNPTGTFTPQFQAVAAILRTNCLNMACHGPSPLATVFLAPQGVNSTDGDVQTALSSQNLTIAGTRLIAPSSPTTSEIYLRITKPVGDIQLMGAGTYGVGATPLAAADIMAIETWIAGGAIYTQ